MKTLLTKILLFAAINATAQPAWRAKLFLHFLDTGNTIVTDTVYFGLDSLGDDGLQAGLDVFDTVVTKNKALGFDATVKQDYQTGCANLKTNIKKLQENAETIFPIYAFGKLRSISWDTSDFVFKPDTLHWLTYAYLQSSNGYLSGIDGHLYGICALYKGEIEFASKDSIMAFSDQPFLQTCSYPYETMDITLRMGFFNRYLGIDEKNEISKINIYPNPCLDNLIIDVLTSTLEYRIIDQFGNTCLEQQLQQGINKIDISQISSGIYYLHIQDTKNVIIKKIIKL